MEYWLSRYEAKDFVRWSVLDKKTGLLIGTIEVCPSLKYAVDGRQMGILRINLKSEYEQWSVLKELMDVLMCHIYEDFEVASIIMKIGLYLLESRREYGQKQGSIWNRCPVFYCRDVCLVDFQTPGLYSLQEHYIYGERT